MSVALVVESVVSYCRKKQGALYAIHFTVKALKPTVYYYKD